MVAWVYGFETVDQLKALEAAWINPSQELKLMVRPADPWHAQEGLEGQVRAC